MKMSNNMQWI